MKQNSVLRIKKKLVEENPGWCSCRKLSKSETEQQREETILKIKERMNCPILGKPLLFFESQMMQKLRKEKKSKTADRNRALSEVFSGSQERLPPRLDSLQIF